MGENEGTTSVSKITEGVKAGKRGWKNSGRKETESDTGWALFGRYASGKRTG